MWVIALLAGLVGLIILVLCVPLDAALNIETPGRPGFRLRLVWLFGLISKELRRARKKPKEKPKKKRAKGFSTILRILRTRGLLRKIVALVKDILGQFRIKELSVNCRLGLDDPADTGLIFALAKATTPFFNLPAKYRFRVQPSFSDEPVFDGHLHGVVRLQPIRLVWPLLRFIFSPAIFRVVKILVLSKWKRKK